jgi:outer membrane lipoprotein-sorting protein
MENKQEGGHTEIDVSDLRYDVDIPDSLFDPMHLREAAAWPGW